MKRRSFLRKAALGSAALSAWPGTGMWGAECLRHEPAFYKPGNMLVTFPVRGSLCGLMICYDGDFPETTRSYANLGCRMVFWRNNRGSRGYDEVRGLARSNSMIMAVSSCSGKDENVNPCRGGSNITGR